MLAKLFNYLWDMKLSFIRRRPMLACWLAWLEGILIGVLIMYFWGQDKYYSMRKTLKDLVLLLQLIVILFLCYTVWQLQIDIVELYNMLIELEDLLLEDAEDMGNNLGNGWNA